MKCHFSRQSQHFCYLDSIQHFFWKKLSFCLLIIRITSRSISHAAHHFSFCFLSFCTDTLPTAPSNATTRHQIIHILLINLWYHFLLQRTHSTSPIQILHHFAGCSWQPSFLPLSLFLRNHIWMPTTSFRRPRMESSLRWISRGYISWSSPRRNSRRADPRRYQ